ncbi:MAG: ABC transporter permease [Planctomycetia bacterium]|nr:ABC transporter permease [Planctomycetia bacterium]
MNEANQAAPGRRYSALRELVLSRLREFYREPEAVFWVYGFPILMVVALGIAFRNKPVEQLPVDVQDGPQAAATQQALDQDTRLLVRVHDEATTLRRWRSGKTDLVVIPEAGPAVRYRVLHDPTRLESQLARSLVNERLRPQPAATEPPVIREEELQEPGSRYVDFLVPGLLGMGLMGGGLWGVGFVIVDMRIRKLLKRLLATPMKRGEFLAAIMISRLCFMVPEVLLMLGFAWLTFGVVLRGSLFALVFLVLLGAFAFAGIGLLVASRAKTMESVSGLMNLIMLPMWMLSGIFFSYERFPEVALPFIRLLPLTALNDALRAVMLEGQSLLDQWLRLAILTAWGAGSFVLALRWFRWQ